jgi:hypothetical protein
LESNDPVFGCRYCFENSSLETFWMQYHGLCFNCFKREFPENFVSEQMFIAFSNAKEPKPDEVQTFPSGFCFERKHASLVWGPYFKATSPWNYRQFILSRQSAQSDEDFFARVLEIVKVKQPEMEAEFTLEALTKKKEEVA